MKSLSSLRVAGLAGLLSAAGFAQTVQQTSVKLKPASAGAQVFRRVLRRVRRQRGQRQRARGRGAQENAIQPHGLQARTKGNFPGNHVFSVIKEDPDMPSDGSKDLPCGAPSSVDVAWRSSEVQLRITNLVGYVNGVQVSRESAFRESS